MLLDYLSGRRSLFGAGQKIKTPSALGDKEGLSRLGLIKHNSLPPAQLNLCCLNNNSCDCGVHK